MLVDSLSETDQHEHRGQEDQQGLANTLVDLSLGRLERIGVKSVGRRTEIRRNSRRRPFVVEVPVFGAN